jgi:hypothetical protein
MKKISTLRRLYVIANFFLPQDVVIGSDTVRVIWAYHHDDPRHGRVTYHGHTRRGVR